MNIKYFFNEDEICPFHQEYIGRVSPNGTSDLCMVNDWTNWHAETTGKTFEWSGDGVCDDEYLIKIE